MPSGSDANGTNERKPTALGLGEDSRKSFCVILQEIRADSETPESFAIKFSLMTKSPLSKIKHIVGRLPATIWSGEGRLRAQRVLTLIEEAGGKGEIVQTAANAAVESAPKEAARKGACARCGFPLKEGDTHCEFCMTAVGEVHTGGGVHHEIRKPVRSIPPKRLAFYLVILVVGIIISLATR
jgi:hypothetical protein